MYLRLRHQPHLVLGRSLLPFMAAAALIFFTFFTQARGTEPVDYAKVHALFKEHCFDCHATQEPESSLVLENFEGVMKGGENGASVIPGNSSDSRLIKFLEGRSGVKGKNQFMPPGKEKKLTPEEISLIRAWIDGGAKPPAQSLATSKRELIVPKIEPKVPPKRSIKALACSDAGKIFAVGRYGEVELYSLSTHQLIRTLSGHRGSVNAVAFSQDGKYLFAAAGQTALFGEVRQWNVADGKLVHLFEGHQDALYSVAVSPDGHTLATGSYDQKIMLWDIASGKPLKTLSGHNGCVFDLSFRPDGQLLASASADRTVKLWDVATGARRDTLSQSLKDVFTVCFSPDGQRLAAGGVDNRIRIWSVSKNAAETTNPLLYSIFAHEGAILKLAYSPDGLSILSTADNRTVKLWRATDVKELLALEKQPDWSPAIAFADDSRTLILGRLDGSIGYYSATTGKSIAAPANELSQNKP